MEYFGLDIAQIVLALITIYLLYIYQMFMSKIAKRDDPFTNANLLAFIIFCVVLQKYVVELIFTSVMGADKVNQTTIVVIRQTILAIEMLFIIIPIRHNFSLEHVET